MIMRLYWSIAFVITFVLGCMLIARGEMNKYGLVAFVGMFAMFPQGLNLALDWPD